MLSDARRWLVILIAPSLVGGVIGSLLVARYPIYFDALVPWLILLATLLLLIDSLRRRKAGLVERGTH